jgi:type II secretory pathway component PulL
LHRFGSAHVIAQRVAIDAAMLTIRRDMFAIVGVREKWVLRRNEWVEFGSKRGWLTVWSASRPT